jgi:hypothetical protein
VQISRKYARKFKEEIGLVTEEKATALDEIIAYVEREDIHDEKELIDLIPELGNALAFVGKALEISGQSRRFKRYINKAAIGRRTLIKYIKEFKEEYTSRKQEISTKYKENLQKIESLKNHLAANNTRYIDLPDPIGLYIAELGAYLTPGKGCGQWATLPRTTPQTLQRHIDNFSARVHEKYETLNTQYDSILPYMEILMQAANSDVVWDEIVKLEYLPDPGTYVYDFTVPGNDSFMVDCGVLVHNTLNTFHLSGVSSASKAVRGVPRIKELLSVTKNIKAPAVTVYLDETIRRSKNEAKKVLNSIQTTFFKDIVKSSKIYFDPDDFNTTIEDDRMFLATYKEFIKADLMEESTLTPWLLRMEFDKEKMKEYEITMMDVSNVIYDFYRETVNCMFSDDSSNNIVMRIKLPDSSNHEDIITELKALEKNIMENIIINGVRKINKVVMNNKEYKIYNEETRTFEPTNEWILETNGTNLLEVLGHKYVDPTRTISNDVNEIYEILGIEATRQALYNEISDIIADGDLYVNYRHISLLVDTMTNKGYLLSIDRHGINRVDIGPLAKCSFEEVTDMLVKAGIFAEVDKISGVSANIMLGQIPPYGTGDTEILIDENKLLDLATIAEEDDDELEEDTDPYLTTMDPAMIHDVCDIENIGFNISIPSIDETIKPITIPITIK